MSPVITSRALRPRQFSLVVLCVCAALVAIVMALSIQPPTAPKLYDGLDEEFELRHEDESYFPSEKP